MVYGLFVLKNNNSNNNVDSSILRIILFPEEKHGCRPIMTAMM